MSGLAALDSGALPLRELLTRVAHYAVRSIPGADGAGLTLIEDDRTDTIVATADFVTAVDDVQYGLGDGPCIMAAREGRTVMSGSLEDEPRWGTFGGQVAAMGVHSVVSLPLRLGDDVVGAMNVYAHAHDAFDERAAELGEAFAVPAAVAVQHAHVLEQTRRLAEQLQAALDDAELVEQAVGVLIGARRRRRGRGARQLVALAPERGRAARRRRACAAGRRRAPRGGRGNSPVGDGARTVEATAVGRQVRKTVDVLSSTRLGQVTNLVDGSAAGVDVELPARSGRRSSRRSRSAIGRDGAGARRRPRRRWCRPCTGRCRATRACG